MAVPQNLAEAFALLNKKDRETNPRFGDHQAHRKWVQKEIERYARDLSFMKGVTSKDYYKYFADRTRRAIEERAHQRDIISQTTPQQFWQAAYDFDPLRAGVPASEAELTKLLASEAVKPIQLGKLYDNTMLWLIPGPNSLPLSEIKAPRNSYARFPAARTDSGAISYPDGHPSIDYETGGSKYQMLIDPQEDSRLRRFCPLGWIAEKCGEGERNWHRTGHALVMDMDHGRDRHPWVVLASQWPAPHTEVDVFRYKAPRRPRRDDDEVRGIFPGDKTRTPVAKLLHIGEQTPSQRSQPFLMQFGPDFKFTLERKGGDRLVRNSRQFKDYHPDLARIMGWFWDAQEKEEVCYAEDGMEFMRYSPRKGKYRVPYLDRVSIAGQNAMFGEVIPERTGPVTLSERLGGLTLQDIVPKNRQQSTTTGY